METSCHGNRHKIRNYCFACRIVREIGVQTDGQLEIIFQNGEMVKSNMK